MEIEDLRELILEDPDDELMRYVLATRLLEADGGDVNEAVTHLQVVVGKDPRNVAAQLALGQALLRLGRDDAARDVLDQGLEVAKTLKHGEGLDLVPQFEEAIENI